MRNIIAYLLPLPLQLQPVEQQRMQQTRGLKLEPGCDRLLNGHLTCADMALP